MNKVLLVAVREYLQTVRTRAFIIGAVIMPMLIIGMMFAADMINDAAEKETKPLRTLLVVDATGALRPALERQVAAFNEELPNQPFALQFEAPDARTDEERSTLVTSGEYYAYLEIPSDILDGGAPSLARVDTQLKAGRLIGKWVNEAVAAARFERAGLDRAEVLKLQTPVELMEIDLRTGEASSVDNFVKFMVPFAFMFLLYMATVQISFGLLTSVIEEKSSRVVEVLLAAVSPTEIMAGKIIGNVFVGATMLAIWGTAGYLGARSQDAGELVTASQLFYGALYFVPGFLLYASLLGAIGSSCNTIQEAQSMASPVTIIGIVPMVLWWLISQEPHSIISVVLSFIPPITPFVMMLRVSVDPGLPLWQIVATQALLWGCAIAMIFAAGKIFRVGVLMYGKAPSLGELVRWVRYA